MAYTTIDKPEGYFNTALWTGNNSSPRDIATGHATDFIWVKFRSSAFNHRLFDNVRGGSKKLISNNTDAEDTGATSDVTAFISTGFTIGSNINNSADGTLVGWSWKANGTGSSNTAGTITSTVSANTTSGFSIVSYTGNGSSSATVGHGLGVAPKMIIIKDRDNGTTAWFVYHSAIGTAGTGRLNSTNTFSDTAFMTTAPSSTLITLTSATIVNGSSEKMIAYCFAEVKGYSKFGSYTGNGSTDGTFVYTGFKPAFIMAKASSTTGQWSMCDNRRGTANTANGEFLFAEDSGATNSAPANWDFLSNGLKARANYAAHNTSGVTYIYMAFAENPFVSSTGIPTTAR